MLVQNIGNRGLLFIFPDFLTSERVLMTIQIYVINAKKHLFICDTGIKRDQMLMLKEDIKEKNLDKKPIIIFNTHSHLDHIGGNGVINTAEIVSHITCRENMIKSIKEMKRKDKNKLDNKSIAYPSIVFQEKLIFSEDNVEFFYSPGHSEDSASCYDKVDKVLYIGDNLVDPFPVITWHRLDKYLKTLENLCKIETNAIILGHNRILKDISFIRETMDYIEKFRDFEINISNFTPNHAAWFRWSLIYMGIDLKEKGKEKEALKYFKYARDLIRHPKIKPPSEEELKQIEDFLRKELKK
ncbi:MAG: MBL fold metallo-hydrolase [Candidatus Odinarchaeota archaeon]